jgi:hypothetical protein
LESLRGLIQKQMDHIHKPSLLVVAVVAILMAAGIFQISRVLSPKEEAVNVQKFGAKCDGRTDNTPAFARAVAAASTRKAPLYIPACGGEPPQYYKGSLRVISGLTVLGGGRTHTVISCVNPATDSGLEKQPDAIAANEVTVRDLQLRGCKYGLDVRGLNYGRFQDLFLFDNDTNMIVGTRAGESGGSIYNVFDHLRMEDATARDLDTDVSMKPNHVNLNQWKSCQFNSGKSKAAQPSRLIGSGGNGAVANSFYGNEFLPHGIVLRQTYGTFLGGNYFEGGASVAHIILDGGVGGTTIEGNYFQAFDTAAIRMGFGESADRTTVMGLFVAGNSFFNETDGAAAIFIPATVDANTADIHIVANHYDPGGKAFTRVADFSRPRKSQGGLTGENAR